jgi:hypothetical protein
MALLCCACLAVFFADSLLCSSCALLQEFLVPVLSDFVKRDPAGIVLDFLMQSDKPQQQQQRRDIFSLEDSFTENRFFPKSSLLEPAGWSTGVVAEMANASKGGGWAFSESASIPGNEGSSRRNFRLPVVPNKFKR